METVSLFLTSFTHANQFGKISLALRVLSSSAPCNNLLGPVYLSRRKFTTRRFVFPVHTSSDNVVLISAGWNKLRNLNNAKCIWKLCGNLASLLGGKKFLTHQTFRVWRKLTDNLHIGSIFFRFAQCSVLGMVLALVRRAQRFRKTLCDTLVYPLEACRGSMLWAV